MSPSSHRSSDRPTRSATRTKQAAGRRLAELDVRLADHLPKGELDALVEITTGLVQASEISEPESGSSETSIVTGAPRSSARRVLSAQRAGLLRSFELRRSLLEDSLNSTEVAELLGSASRQTAHDRSAAGTLLAIRDGGRLRYPIWQFDAEGPDGVLEGMPEVLSALPALTQLGRLAWFVTPKRGLDSRTPVQALKDGELARVLAEARASHAS